MSASEQAQALKFGTPTVKMPHPLLKPAQERTDPSWQIIDTAQKAMRDSNCGHISTLHLLLGVLTVDAAATLLCRANLDIEAIRGQALRQIVPNGKTATTGRRFTPNAKRAIKRARLKAITWQSVFFSAIGSRRDVNPEQLLLALLNDTDVRCVITAAEATALHIAYRDSRRPLVVPRPTGCDLLAYLNPFGLGAIRSAEAIAQQEGAPQISTVHLLLALVSHRYFQLLLERAGIDHAALKRDIENSPQNDSPDTSHGNRLSPGVQHILERAYAEAASKNCRAIKADHLLISLLPEPGYGEPSGLLFSDAKSKAIRLWYELLEARLD